MITEISLFKHLSSMFTVQDVVGLTKQAVRQLEVQTEYPVPLNLIRKLYNLSVSNVQELLVGANLEAYSVTVKATIDASDGNIFIVDLDTMDITGGDFKWGSRTYTNSEFNLTASILRIETLYNELLGTFQYKTMEELISCSTGENKLFDKSFLWSQSGNKILIYMGVDARAEYDDLRDPYIKIKLIRTPVLDDLKHPYEYPMQISQIALLDPNRIYSETYFSPLDIPDKYVNLVLLEMKKNTFEALSQPIPEALENKIQGILQSLQSGVQTKVTEEQIKDNKET